MIRTIFKKLTPHSRLLVLAGGVMLLTNHFPSSGDDGWVIANPLVPKSFAAKLQTAPQSGVDVTGGTGIAVFQDIQVPVNDGARVRGDGKFAAEEFQNHVGIPLMVGLGYGINTSRWNYKFGLDLMQVRSTTGPAATQSSGYNRMELHSSAAYGFDWGSAGPTLGLRRSSFTNVSTGHFIDSALIGVAAHFAPSKTWHIGMAVQYSPFASFAYNPGKGFAGETFESGTTDFGTYQVDARTSIYKDTWLTFGLEQEVAKVVINDVSEYNSFGLNVSPTSIPSRQYDLATTVVKFGFQKNF